jgi:hypothetical protein
MVSSSAMVGDGSSPVAQEVLTNEPRTAPATPVAVPRSRVVPPDLLAGAAIAGR